MVTSSNGYRAHEGAAMPAPDPLERIRTAAAAAAATTTATSSSATAMGMDAGRTAAATDEAVEALKMEIREVKAAIWEGKLKLAAAAEAEERQWLRQEQRWLWDETRLMREEVKLRLEWRNGLVLQQQQQQQQQQQLAGCGRFVEPPPLGGGCGGAAAAAGAGANGAGWKMPASGWMFPEFMPGWLPPPLPSPQDGHRQQQQQQQLRREPEMGVDMSGWIVPQQQPQLQQQLQQQIPQQQQQERQRSRLPPLRPRKDPSGVASLPEAKTDPVTMQPLKNNNTKKRKNSAVKEEQEMFVGREERGKRPRWKDHWVMHLIQVRGGMQDEFNKPPKQGVDLWRQVYSKLVASCPDFDKEPEACRKKWKMIVTDYKASSNHEGNERPEKCRWYQMMDEYINLRDIQTSVTDGGDSNAGTIVGLEEMDESRKDDIQSKITGLV